MPLPTLPGPVILQLRILLNSPDSQVLALWQIVLQATASAQNPIPDTSVKVPIAEVKIDLKILDVGEVAADVVGNGNKDIGVGKLIFTGFE